MQSRIIDICIEERLFPRSQHVKNIDKTICIRIENYWINYIIFLPFERRIRYCNK